MNSDAFCAYVFNISMNYQILQVILMRIEKVNKTLQVDMYTTMKQKIITTLENQLIAHVKFHPIISKI